MTRKEFIQQFVIYNHHLYDNTITVIDEAQKVWRTIEDSEVSFAIKEKERIALSVLPERKESNQEQYTPF